MFIWRDVFPIIVILPVDSPASIFSNPVTRAPEASTKSEPEFIFIWFSPLSVSDKSTIIEFEPIITRVSKVPPPPEIVLADASYWILSLPAPPSISSCPPPPDIKSAWLEPVKMFAPSVPVIITPWFAKVLALTLTAFIILWYSEPSASWILPADVDDTCLSGKLIFKGSVPEKLPDKVSKPFWTYAGGLGSTFTLIVRASEAKSLKVKTPFSVSKTGLLSLSVITTVIGRVSVKSSAGSPSLKFGDLIGLLKIIFWRIFS